MSVPHGFDARTFDNKKTSSLPLKRQRAFDRVSEIKVNVQDPD
jgi:hypothetical protein